MNTLQRSFPRYFFLSSLLAGLVMIPAIPAETNRNDTLDQRVRGFLDRSRHSWYDMNVPGGDGQILYDLIIKHNYKQALEIGTSTGHSGVWIAWALSKTGGKLITIEIDESRYRTALANFREAGLETFIDARLADAHELVPRLHGPFDFVFCDADKEWYTQYLKDVLPKLLPGGCFAAHNVTGRRGWRGGGTAEFYEYVLTLPHLQTSLHPDSYSGISLSYKKVNR